VGISFSSHARISSVRTLLHEKSVSKYPLEFKILVAQSSLRNALVPPLSSAQKIIYQLFHVAVIRGVHGQSILYTLLETEILEQLKQAEHLDLKPALITAK